MVYRLVINPHQLQNQQISLLPEQDHYLRRVLRLNNGDRFITMDGKKNCWLTQLTPKGAEIIEIVTNDHELPIAVTLITGLPKGSGFEEIVRYGTELGVSRFIPVISERTLLKPSTNKLQRWRKIAIEAAEQSERQIVPQISEIISFNELISQINTMQGSKFITVARQTLPHFATILAQPSSQEIIIATGPEGGWTFEEVEKAKESGFQPVSLGKRILRAITAPIVVMSIMVAKIEK